MALGRQKKIKTPMRYPIALVVLGVLFHFLALLSMFDLYFRSPVVHGMVPHVSPLPPPAKRLVLFVGDGLRADKLFQRGYETPFLREIIETKGAFGVSHTRVPTESRPGHIAMISGFYEDVSAVTTGWKENTVPFDSCFNESRWTWSWGSPDILPMFGKGHEDHIFMDSYTADFEDFSSDSTQLDSWVFDRVETFLDQSADDLELTERLHQDKSIFFLHLLGIDSAGHSKRPYSEAYLQNIKYVDEGVQRIYEKFERFYPDGETAYVFASDHGMSDRGNHGDGERANTETPLILWGAGIRGAQRSSVPDQVGASTGWSVDSPPSWRISHLRRVDVEQGDIAPLMSSLIGIPFPLNSVGVLPLDYLSMSVEEKAHNMVANAKEIFALLKMNHEIKRKERYLFEGNNVMTMEEGVSRLKLLEDSLVAEKFDQVINGATEFILTCLQAQNYYQTYDRQFLFAITTIGYIGWIFFVLTRLVQSYSVVSLIDDIPRRAPYSVLIWSLGAILFAIVSTLLFLQQFALRYYFYFLFPISFWVVVLTKRHVWVLLFQREEGAVGSESQAPWVKNVLLLVGTIVLQELQVAGFFHRGIFSVAIAVVGLWGLIQKAPSNRLKVCWVVSTWSLAVFPLLPTAAGEVTSLVWLGGVSLAVLTYVMLSPRISSRFRTVGFSGTVPVSFTYRQNFQLLLLLLSSYLVYDTESSLYFNQGLPIVNQILSILTLSFSLLSLAFLPPQVHYYDGLLYIVSCIATPFILLSISYEVFFYLALCAVLLCWCYMERSLSLSQNSARPHDIMYLEDTRVVLFYMLFCWLAFFGTGNVMGISSFEISSTYRFMTVFQPFTMSALLILKIFLPFAMVASAFGIVIATRKISVTGSFYAVVAITDVMSVTLFYFVQDYGSWKEIGVSIGHFAGVNAFILFHILLFGLYRLLFRRGINTDIPSSVNAERPKGL